jgi:hypothetical protein
MTGRIEIYHYGLLIHQEPFRLWEVEEMSWESKAQSRERQYNSKIVRLIKSMPFFNPDHTKIFVTFKSKLNNAELSDIQEVLEQEGVSQNQ